MFRKIAMGAVLVGAGLLLVNTTGLGSYAATLYHKVRGTVKNQVPLEFEIERLRHEITQLGPDMAKNLEVVAIEDVAVKELREDITRMHARLKQEKVNLRTMSEDVSRGGERLIYDGQLYSRERVKVKLERDLATAKRFEEELKSKEKLLEAKERSLTATMEQIAGLRSQRQQLEVELAQLETELKTLRLQQTQSKVQFDDSRLANIKNSLAEIRTRMRVDVKKMELQGQFVNNDFIPVDKKARPVNDVVKEVNAFVGDGKTESSVAGGK